MVVEPTTPGHTIGAALAQAQSGLAVVVEQGKFLGIIPSQVVAKLQAGTRLAKSEAAMDMMRPAEAVRTVPPEAPLSVVREMLDKYAYIDILPLVNEAGEYFGSVSRDIIAESDSRAFDMVHWPAEQLHPTIMETVTVGVIFVDRYLVVRYLNQAAAQLTGCDRDSIMGGPYETVAAQFFLHYGDFLANGIVPRVLKTGQAVVDHEASTCDGKNVLVGAMPIYQMRELVGAVISMQDVTVIALREKKVREEADELEQAFALSLPNSKVEMKLKRSPEYRDIYHAETGLIEIVEVIQDGTYRHVVNGLRILAELKRAGIFNLVAIDKDIMVEAFIYHDIGKVQPILQPGDMVDPKAVFEMSLRHASRSADYAHQWYGISSQAEWLVRYHHTQEDDLPRDFPQELLPMWRLFRVVDGLSAGMTRRLATIKLLSVSDTWLTVVEENVDKRYHRAYRLCLYTGQIVDISGYVKDSKDSSVSSLSLPIP